MEISCLSMQALALCLLAFATLDHNPGEQALTALRARAAACVAQFDTQAIANCLWALALLRELPAVTWNLLVGTFARLLGSESSSAGQHKLMRAAFILLGLCRSHLTGSNGACVGCSL